MTRIFPHPAQLAFLRDPHRFVLAAAGAQSGKTIAAAAKFCKRVTRDYNTRIAAGDVRPDGTPIITAWVVVPSYRLAKVPYRYLRQRWPDGWRNKHGEIYTECEPYPRCLVSIRSAEIPSSLVSEAVDALWLNETARMDSEAWRGGLLMRLNATHGWALFDTTPMGQNWVYHDLYLRGLTPLHVGYDKALADPEYATHIWHAAANPAIPPEVIESARRNLPPAFFAREYLADFSAFHGQVWPDFKREIHVKPCDASSYPEIVLGVDWGYAPGHLGVVLVVGVDRKQRRAGILEEYAHSQKTDSYWHELIASLAEKFPLSRIWCDPARPDKLAELRRYLSAYAGAGTYHVPAVREADNAVWEGVTCLAELTHTGGLLVHPSCVTTTRQMIAYHWQSGTERSGGEYKEQPAKVDDDTCDAARYAIYSELRRQPISGR